MLIDLSVDPEYEGYGVAERAMEDVVTTDTETCAVSDVKVNRTVRMPAPLAPAFATSVLPSPLFVDAMLNKPFDWLRS